MVRKIAMFLIGLFAIINVANTQVTVKISDDSANVGQTVDIDVSLDNFVDIVLFQYSINWDETKFTFNSLVNVTTELEQFSGAGSVGSPDNGGDDGELTVSWSKTNTQPETLPDGTRLFTIRLNAVGAECTESTVRLSNNPAVIEFVDSNTNNVGAVANNGVASIDGTSCNGGGGDLTISAPDVSTDAGTNICVPLTVTDFTDVSSMTFDFLFDPAILSYTGIQNPALPGFSGSGNVFESSPGKLSVFWFDNTGTTPSTVTGTLFEVCYDAIGSANQTSNLEFEDSSVEFTLAPNDTPLPFVLDDGSVTITGMTGGDGDFTLISGDATFTQGGNTCVPIAVKNFVNIQSMQFALMWDESVLTYASTQNYNLVELTAANFNPTADNKLRVTWNNLTGGTNVVDNTAIFEVCFEGSGDCDATTSLMFTNDPPISIEVSNGLNEVVPVNFEVGTGTIECDQCNISIASLSNVSCNGADDGSIEVNLGSGTYDCVWTDGSGTVIQQSNDCDIFNLAPGSYTLAIDDGDACQETRTFEITEPAAIVFGGSKMDETDGCDGSISIQIIGGTAPFDFLWDDGSNGNIQSNLCAGEYCVTVTDAENCVAENCFTINSAGIGVVDVDISNIKCFGDDDGSIDITPDGGVAPYTFAWSGPSGDFTTEDISGLSAGNYDLTITDSNSEVFTMTYSVTQPNEIKIESNIVKSDGNNGSIDISVTGGLPPYSYSWSDGPTTEDRTGLPPGIYTVLVTDDNNCNVSSGPLNVSSTSIVINITSPSSVSCNGTCDGAISGEVSGGSGVFTYKLNGDVVSFPVSELCPGSYTFTVEDDDGLIASEDFEIGEPSQLTVDISDSIDCIDGDNGFIEVDVQGGVGGYTYVWNVPGSGDRISGLSAGTYSVLVTDDNGCQVAEEDIRLNSCGPDVPCLTHRPVISPNGDDFNNEFYIACVTDFENKLRVYNRWGVLVFGMDNYDNTWTGLDTNGNELQEGGYMWILEVTNEDGSKEIKRGTLTILRDQF